MLPVPTHKERDDGGHQKVVHIVQQGRHAVLGVGVLVQRGGVRRVQQRYAVRTERHARLQRQALSVGGCESHSATHSTQHTQHTAHNRQAACTYRHGKAPQQQNFLLGMGVDARQTSDVMHTRKKLRRPMSAWLHFSSPNGTGNSGCGFVAAWLNARVPKKLLHTGKKASHRVTEGCPHIGSGHNALLTAQHTNGVVLKRHLRNNDKGSEDDAVPHGATAASGQPSTTPRRQRGSVGFDNSRRIVHQIRKYPDPPNREQRGCTPLIRQSFYFRVFVCVTTR